MGSTARVVVAGEERLLEAARVRIGELEACWTRFRESELTRLNGRAGEWTPVSADLFRLVEVAVAAWRATRGRFDPTVHDAVVAGGYVRSLGRAELGRVVLPVRPDRQVRAPGCAGLRLDPVARAVRLPREVRLDPGGIGKGLAADVVSAELLAAGASGALVSVGGDLRVRGTAPGGGPWTVTVEHPFRPADDLARLSLADGGVATSSRLRRRWRTGAGWGHHMVDPATGRPTGPALVAASAVAGECWWAEALATAALVAGAAWRDAVVPAGAPVAVVTAGGLVQATPSMREVLTCPAS